MVKIDHDQKGCSLITNRLVLIDAFALIHRAYHALPPFTTKDGQPVGAVYGFTSALLAAIKNLEPEYLAVGIDLPKPTKRHEEYVEYKAHRAPAPDDLVAQIPIVKEVLATFNIPVFAMEGYEGEDVIATIVAKVKSQKAKGKSMPKGTMQNVKMEYIIVTGDLDCLQLVDRQTKVYSMARGVNQAVMYDNEKVRERYGLTPAQFVDFKALKGDASDNIPGVPGIGEKGAASLIKQFGSLESLYDVIASGATKQSGTLRGVLRRGNLRSPRPDGARDDNDKKIQKDIKISGKLLKILEENKEQAFLSQKLSKIVDDVPIDFNLSSAKIHDYDYKKVVKLFNKLGFRSLVKRLPESHRENLQQTLL